MSLEFGGKPKAWQEQKAREFFENYGDRPRRFRNGFGLTIPSDDQIEILRRSVRYLLAIEQVKAKAKQLNLTDEQKGQLRERESTERGAIEAALLKLYLEVWLPHTEAGGIAIDSVAVGGRPLQTTLNDKKEAAIHERITELLTVVHKRVFASIAPTKVVELFRLGESEPQRLGMRLAEVVDGFYAFLGFPRLTSQDVVRKAAARGVREGIFGYCSGALPELGDDGKYKVAPERVRIIANVAEDEIDLDTGFIMLPQAVPQTPPPVACLKCGKWPCECARPPEACPKCGKSPCVCKQPPACPRCGQIPCVCSVPPEKPKVVEIAFTADRNALFTAWNAAANLADLAGKVQVTLRAESESGFDKAKLQNGVIEPLKEADLIE